MDLLWFPFFIYIHTTLLIWSMCFCVIMIYDMHYILFVSSQLMSCDVHLISMYVIKILMSQENKYLKHCHKFYYKLQFALTTNGGLFYTWRLHLSLYLNVFTKLSDSESNQENIIPQPEICINTKSAYFLFQNSLI